MGIIEMASKKKMALSIPVKARAANKPFLFPIKEIPFLLIKKRQIKTEGKDLKNNSW